MGKKRFPAEAVVSAFAQVARGQILQDFGETSCIGSTRIALDVFNSFGIRAWPLKVQAAIMNVAMQENLERLEQAQDKRKEALEQVYKETGAHCMVIGEKKGDEDEPGKWNGHLVAIVGSRWLVDASIDQANRPQRNIKLPDVLVAPLVNDFVTGKMNLAIERKDGLYIEYRAQPEDKESWKDTPNWTQRWQTKPVVNRIVAILKRVLESGYEEGEITVVKTAGPRPK